MANKIAKNQDDNNHRITIKCDVNGGEVVLVRGGKRAYLWIGADNRCVTHVSGPATLRALAHAILKEVGND